MSGCKILLPTEEAQEAIRAESNITGALNGPQGHVSAKTVRVQSQGQQDE